MRNRHLLLTVLLSIFSLSGFAQSQDAGLAGKVTDGTEAQYSAIVKIYTGGSLKGATTTDDDGKYSFAGLQPGPYDSVTVHMLGKVNKVVLRVVLEGDKITDLDIDLHTSVNASAKVLGEISVVFNKHVFNKRDPGAEKTTNAADFKHAAGNGTTYMAQFQAGVVTSSNGTNLAGGRGDGTVYYVDGVKAIGNINLPQSAIEQSSVLTSGISAEYGDATGGIITITSRGPAGVFGGGFNYLTSQYLDAYGYNYFDGYLTGPLKKSKGENSRTILGYFISGAATIVKDNSPSGIPIYTAKSDVLSALEANPLRRAPKTDVSTINSDIFIPGATYVNNSGIETVKFHPNIPTNNYNVSGKLEYNPTENIFVTAGASGNYNRGLAYISQYSMFNSDNNPEVIGETYRGYIRYKQNLKIDPKSAVTQAYFTIQADYQTVRNTTWDPNLKDDYFKYGYIGKFDQFTRRSYSTDPITHVSSEGNYLIDSVKFTPGNVLNTTQNYTRQYFANKQRVGSLSQIQNEGGLINGQQPTNVNSLWSGVGTVYGSVSKSQTDQFNMYFSGLVRIKAHEIKFGFNYEQRVSRGYTVSTPGLWTLARQLTNSHLSVDTTKKDSVFDKYGNFLDTVNYRFQSANQRTFDKNFREYLESKGAVDIHGKPITSESYVNVDGYNPNDYNNMSSYLAQHGRPAGKLNMFSADELLNQGSSLINYYGYDYLGNKPTKKLTVDDFLLDSLHRYIAAFQPIYIAGYIQDAFDFRDIHFRVGLRVERYDANEPVLKDPYSVLPTYTVGDINGKYFGSTKFTKPGNIGDNYVPYVNDPLNPSSTPIGFRDPSTNKWYDASGKEVTDVSYLASLNGGQLNPYVNASGISRNDLSKPVSASFRQYQPQVTYSPRISFTFPISDEAVFYASYDIMNQRPTGSNFFTIDDYYFLKERSTGVIDNPNLKPETRINYQLGFKQKLSNYSALTIEATYGELRNMIQLHRINFAYPVTSYTTYDNIDFGTVKGLTLMYLMKRASSHGVEFNTNYTLQFANGTGSSAGSQGALIEAGQPNLRTPLPLDYDVRHKINATLDFRFGNGIEYIGPSDSSKTAFHTFLNKFYHAIFENGGFFAAMTASSGMPYTRQSNVTESVGIGIAQRTTILGQPNDARLPWNYRIDLSYDKDILIKSHKNQENNNGRTQGHYLNIRITVQNLLNTQNIFSVYHYTGRADDDGFLASAEGQKYLAGVTDLAARQAFQNQYSARLLSPGNYGSPRVIRLGLSYSF